ncbi:MAG: DUF4292 domain-containing protein [Cyclobacteriaceae bacterium]
MKLNKIFGLLIICSLIFSSCKKELSTLGTGDEKFGIENLDFKYVEAKAKLKYNSGKQKIGATASFRIKKDSIIWVSVSPGLGLEVARLLVDKKGIQVLDKLKREYYDLKYDYLSELYGFEVNFSLIEAVVIGNTLFEPTKRKQVKDDGRFYNFSKEEGQYGVRQYIGKRSKKLERLEAYHTLGGNTVLVNYGGFQNFDLQRAPQKIRAKIDLIDTKDQAIIDIEYSKMDLLNEPLEFPFSVSSKYTKK